MNSGEANYDFLNNAILPATPQTGAVDFARILVWLIQFNFPSSQSIARPASLPYAGDNNKGSSSATSSHQQQLSAFTLDNYRPHRFCSPAANTLQTAEMTFQRLLTSRLLTMMFGRFHFRMPGFYRMIANA